MKILLTGAAGFIGAHCALRLLRDGQRVVGVDNFNDYYDPALKEARVDWVREQAGDFPLLRFDLADAAATAEAFAEVQPDVVIHLAAQAGVRYSLSNPRAYASSNLDGFLNILEGCRAHPVQHLLYASSSSVYGANQQVPYSVHDNVDHPLSLYAATKKANELMAHSYSHLYGIPTAGLRFFTVYGPWGRPDMAYFKFTDAIVGGRPIDLYNHGRMERDFTYVDDIVDGITSAIERATPTTAGRAPHRVYNLGNSCPEQLGDMVAILERLLGRGAMRNLLPMQPGDVRSTCADISLAAGELGYRPKVTLEQGLERFVAWHRSYYGRQDRLLAAGSA